MMSFKFVVAINCNYRWTMKSSAFKKYYRGAKTYNYLKKYPVL